MRKVFLILAAVLPLLCFTSCSDDESENMKTIKNLTGKTWYDAQIWFMDSTEAESMTGFQDVGDVEVGETCTVESESAYFLISAEDSRGRLIMSQPKRLSEYVSVDEDDLF